MPALHEEWAELRRIARHFGLSPRRIARATVEALSLAVFAGGIAAAAVAFDPREGFQLPPEGLGGAVAEAREGSVLAPVGFAGREGRGAAVAQAGEDRSERWRAGSFDALHTAEAKPGAGSAPAVREGSRLPPGGARGASVAEVRP